MGKQTPEPKGGPGKFYVAPKSCGASGVLGLPVRLQAGSLSNAMNFLIAGDNTLFFL